VGGDAEIDDLTGMGVWEGQVERGLMCSKEPSRLEAGGIIKVTGLAVVE